MTDILFGILMGIGVSYIARLCVLAYGKLRVIIKEDKPKEPLFTEKQEKQLDNLANIAFSVYQMWHKLPLEYAKKMPPEAIQIEEIILKQAESTAGLTGKCYIKSKVQALLRLEEYNNPTKDDSK